MRIKDPTVLGALPELGVVLEHGVSLAQLTYLGIGGA
jgi:hypothetical protein